MYSHHVLGTWVTHWAGLAGWAGIAWLGLGIIDACVGYSCVLAGTLHLSLLTRLSLPCVAWLGVAEPWHLARYR